MFAFDASESGGTAELTCVPGAELIRVTVYDAELTPLALNFDTGNLRLKVRPGLYKVVFSAGSTQESQLVLLAEGESRTVSPQAPLKVRSAAPLERSTTSREFQSGPAAHNSRRHQRTHPQSAPGSGRIYIFVRDPEDNVEEFDGNAGQGLSLRTIEGSILASCDQAVPEETSADADSIFNAYGRWALIDQELSPGTYLLRLELPNGAVAVQAVHVVAGWQTQIFLLCRTYFAKGKDVRRADLASMSIFMSRTGEGVDLGRPDLYLTELGRRALADRTTVLREQQSAMLQGKFENPVLGLIGAYLLLRGEKPSSSLVREIYDNLWRLIPGHPDLAALGHAILEAFASDSGAASLMTSVRERQGATRFHAPPTLRASFDTIIRASYANPDLIPSTSLCGQIATRTLLSSAWLTWYDAADTKVDEVAVSSASVRHSKSLDFELASLVSSEGEHHGSTASADFTEGATGAEGARDVDASSILAGLNERLAGHNSLHEALVRARLTPLEMRVVQAAFPEADPLLGKVMANARTRLKLDRPDAVTLGQSLCLPAQTLQVTLKGIAEKL